MPCAICNKKTKEPLIARTEWTRQGHFGRIPIDARVHDRCDKKEQADIKAGRQQPVQWIPSPKGGAHD